MRNGFRWVGGIAVLGLAILGVSYLQARFDRADLGKAVRAVELQEPGTGPCHAEILSRVRGRVRVLCGERRWVVDVVKGVVGREDEENS